MSGQAQRDAEDADARYAAASFGYGAGRQDMLDDIVDWIRRERPRIRDVAADIVAAFEDR